MKLLTVLIMCGIFLGWFDIDSDHNHNVYVSGLPLDITVEEFVKLMGKCGIITEDENGRHDCVNMDRKYVLRRGEGRGEKKEGMGGEETGREESELQRKDYVIMWYSI